MADLDIEITAYRKERAQLEMNDSGKWVVFRKEDRVGLFDTFEAAATAAVEKFGRGPYLIRQVGAQPAALPVGAVQRRADGPGKVRL